MTTYAEAMAKGILSLCQLKGITVNKLAMLSGLNQSTVDNVINCRTKSAGIRTLHKIAQGLGIPISEMLDFPEINEIPFDDE